MGFEEASFARTDRGCLRGVMGRRALPALCPIVPREEWFSCCEWFSISSVEWPAGVTGPSKSREGVCDEADNTESCSGAASGARMGTALLSTENVKSVVGAPIASVDASST